MAKDLNKVIDQVDMSLVANKRDLLNMTSNVVAAYLGNHKVGDEDVANVIERVYEKLTTLNASGPPLAPSAALPAHMNSHLPMVQRPAVPINESVFADYLICLEDGAKLKMLKRHLRTSYGLTPEQYRAKWGLPSDYPMVAPNYAKLRSRHAKQIGLGRKAPGTQGIGADKPSQIKEDF